MNGKIETYIGFAIKKGSAVFGCDGIERYKKKIHLILYVGTLSENSLSVLREVADKRGCPLVEIEEYGLLKKKNCKALAICDKSLADVIILNLKDDCRR